MTISTSPTAQGPKPGDLCTATFEGPAGLRRIPPGWIVTTTDPSRFRAKVALRRLGGLVFMSSAATAHEARRTTSALMPDRGVAFVHVLAGCSDFEIDGERVPIRPGETAVLRTDQPYRYRVDEPTRTMCAVIPRAEFPPHLLDEIGPMPPRALAPTPTTQPLQALIHEVMFGSGELTEQTRRYLGRAIIDLSVGLLVARRHEFDENDGAARVRLRITEYIDDHLTEPDLGPSRIAEDLGFSVRYLHQSFSAPGVSVARYIRHSRLDRVASAIDEARTLPTLGSLASRFGFNSGDHLGRAFSERFGMSVREFASRPQHAAITD